MPLPAPPESPLRYRARHTTRYDYGEAVSLSHHLMHLSARPHPRQLCRDHYVTVTPTPAVRTGYTDYFGNPVTYAAVQEPHRTLIIEAGFDIEVRPPPPFDPDRTPPWENLRDQGGEYAFESALVRVTPALVDYARPSFPPGRAIGRAAIDLTARIHRDFAFDPAATTVATPLSEVLANRRGVCQDFAHLQIGCLRALGLPARYVSGYLRTRPPPGEPRLIGADASHAWASVWCGDDVWVDLCPTNGRPADADFITLAWGRDYDDVSPVRGIIVGSGLWHTLLVEVDVEVIE